MILAFASYYRKRAALSVIFLSTMISSYESYADGMTGVSGSNASYIMQVFMGLLAVLALIFALAWLARRISGGTFLQNQHMQIVSSLSLGAREKLLLVELGEKQLLLGITAQNINTLHVIDEPIVDTKTQREVSDFSRKIKDIMKKGQV
ncbi:flagellar biosynthetic protein FliO [Aurantivibrio plasticivorans]